MKKRILFESNGLKLAGDFYLVDKAAPTLLFLHGMSFYSFEYEKLAPLLAKKGFNCLTFDFRGHGDSEGKRGDWRLKELVLDVISALDFIKSECSGPVGVFGNSLGSVTAVYSAARDKRIKSVVCCNSPTKPSVVLYTPFRKGLMFMMKNLSKIIPFTLNISYFIPHSLVLTDKHIIKQVESDSKIFDARKFTTDTYREMIRWDAANEAKQVYVPMLIIHGTKDRLQPVSQSVLLFESANEPKQLRLIETGHVPTLENAEELSRILGDWFAQTL